MKLIWLGYLVYSLGNGAIKLYIETGLIEMVYMTDCANKVSLRKYYGVVHKTIMCETHMARLLSL